jgi:serine/threonine protein kinase
MLPQQNMTSTSYPFRELSFGDLVAGKYRIEGLIGSGGMGRVYGAVNEAIGQRVAIKILNPSLDDAALAKSRFLQEARAAAALQSEHVCRVFDVGLLDDGEPYIVMERLSGETLSQRLQRGALPPRDALEIIAQISEALLEAHALGIVHRDIKTANIFILKRAKGYRAKLLDFGIAKMLGEFVPSEQSSLTALGSALGTTLFMSPEQMSDSSAVGPATDVWALGVTLYLALSREYPFRGLSAVELAVNATNRRYISLDEAVPNLPAGISELVDECFAPAATRITVHALSLRLERIVLSLGSEPPMSMPASSSSTPLRLSLAPAVFPTREVSETRQVVAPSLSVILDTDCTEPMRMDAIGEFDTRAMRLVAPSPRPQKPALQEAAQPSPLSQKPGLKEAAPRAEKTGPSERARTRKAKGLSLRLAAFLVGTPLLIGAAAFLEMRLHSRPSHQTEVTHAAPPSVVDAPLPPPARLASPDPVITAGPPSTLAASMPSTATTAAPTATALQKVHVQGTKPKVLTNER